MTCSPNASRRVLVLLFGASVVLLPANPLFAQRPSLRVATFQVDVTPPLGCPLCNGAVQPARRLVDRLSARGIVLMGSGPPIVLCAVDWLGIANGGHDAWQEALAAAAGTSPDRVSVHTLHQHDAPGCDFEAEEILTDHALGGSMFNVAFARQTIERAAAALRKALQTPRDVTHVGLGQARVFHVASSRRLLGPDGKIQYVRWSGNNSAAVRAIPEGTIDPDVRSISLWDGDRPLAVLTYYATHPMSNYGKGGVSHDFVGEARELREAALPAVAHIHFDGAGGDLTAGKYNDGSPGVRHVLAQRLAAGMQAAWDSTRRVPIRAEEIHWQTTEVSLPVNERIADAAALERQIDNRKLPMARRVAAACDLAWLRREKAGHKVVLSCLRLGRANVLSMPGELSVVYQLAAEKMRPRDFVCMAAYKDYGPGYVCMSAHYAQGGYEPSASRVGPGVESVLMAAMRKLLE